MADPQLEPKTKEVWAGVRLLSSMVSELQQQVQGLRDNLSGFDGYRDLLRNTASFDELESALKDEFANVSEISDEDVTNTVDLLHNNFTDFDTYVGGSNSGALSQSNYDQYRSYLMNNGIADIDADEHIQLLQESFDPDAAFASDVGSHSDWDSFKTDLTNNGVSSSSAETTVDRLQTIFNRVSQLDRAILGESAWTDVETLFENRGLTSSETTSVVDDLKTAYGSSLNESAKDGFSDFDSYSEFESYLANLIGSDQAPTFIDKLQGEFNSYADFRANFLSENSLETLLNEVEHGSETGDTDSGAGVHVWEDNGTTESGQSASAGDVSVRTEGNLYFEQIGSTSGGDEPSTGTTTISNLSVSSTSINPDETVTATVEVTNSQTGPVDITTTLQIDGSVKATKTKTIGGGDTRNVSFKSKFDTVGEYEIGINDTGPQTVTVTYPNKQPK